MKNKIIIAIISIIATAFLILRFQNYVYLNTPKYLSYIYDSNLKSMNYIVYGKKGNKAIKYIEDGMFYLVKTNYDTINIIYASDEISEIKDLKIFFTDARNDTFYNVLQSKENNINSFYETTPNKGDGAVLMHSFYVGNLDSNEIEKFQKIKDSLITSLE